MAKYTVQAVHREGFPGVWTPGRLWPSDKAVEIEVLDQDDCPRAKLRGKGPDGQEVFRDGPDPVRVGRLAFEEMRKEPRLSINPIGGLAGVATATLVAAEMKAAALTDRVRELEAANRLLDDRNAGLQEQLDSMEGSTELQRLEIERLRGKMVKFEAEAADFASGTIEIVSGERITVAVLKERYEALLAATGPGADPEASGIGSEDPTPEPILAPAGDAAPAPPAPAPAPAPAAPAPQPGKRGARR